MIQKKGIRYTKGEKTMAVRLVLCTAHEELEADDVGYSNAIASENGTGHELTDEHSNGNSNAIVSENAENGTNNEVVDAEAQAQGGPRGPDAEGHAGRRRPRDGVLGRLHFIIEGRAAGPAQRGPREAPERARGAGAPLARDRRRGGARDARRREARVARARRLLRVLPRVGRRRFDVRDEDGRGWLGARIAACHQLW